MRTSTSTNKGILLVLLALTGALIAGCGDSDSDSEPSDPEIPAAVAGRLAELSDETADELAGGDGCAAEETVDELEHQVELTKAQLPAELRPELEAGVQKLAAKIECVPLPPVTEEPEPAPLEEEKPKEKKPEKAKPEEQEAECPPGLEKKGEGCVAQEGEGGDGGHGEGGNEGNGTGGTTLGAEEEGREE